MDRKLLEYLRDMALELSALAEEGDFEPLSHIFSMAALDAGQRLGPTVVWAQDAVPTGGFLAANDDLARAAIEQGPAN
jgi:hypothetical protein